MDSALQAAVDVLPANPGGGRMIGLAGTVSTLACIELGLAAYDRDLVHHSVLTREQVRGWLDRLSTESPKARAMRPCMEPGRADVIVGGVVVLLAVMEAFGCDECLVSESDILDGLVATMLADPPAGHAVAAAGIGRADDVVRAYGGAVWRAGQGGPEVVLVHRLSYEDWSIPKGKLDVDENPLDCALREVWEETAIRCRAGAYLGTVCYAEQNRRTGVSLMKEVGFFEMEPVEVGTHVPDDEIDEMAWLPLEEARRRCSYPTDREILARLERVIAQRA